MAAGALLPTCAFAIALRNSALQMPSSVSSATLTELYQISSSELKKRHVPV